MKFWLTFYGFLIISALLLAHEWMLFPDNTLRIQLLNIGQGDSILITTPGHQRILIDGGPDLSLLERLGEELPFLNRNIDLLILTHTDSDHVTALPEVLRRYDVKQVLLSGVANKTSRYSAFLHQIKQSGAEVIFADAEHDLDLGHDVFLDILWPQLSMLGNEVEDPNNASIVAKLTWKDHSILLTGDIEEKIEEELLKAGYDLSSEILKVPHHGSLTSSSTGFLLAVNPDLALIPVGSENTFGHPHPDVLARYEKLGISVMRTDRERVEVVLE